MRAGLGIRVAGLTCLAMACGTARGHGQGQGSPRSHAIQRPPIVGGPVIFFSYGPPYGYGYGFGVAPQWPGPGPGLIGLGPLSYLPPAPSVILGGDLSGPPSSSARPRTAPTRAAAPDRSAHLVTLGDRFFRAADTRRAADRYGQARDADPRSAAPHIRLAQLDLLKGRYSDAADRLRDAVVVEPNCLGNARDIRALYGEPAEFARSIARIEAHLQAEPDDRDAWLVLGAQFYLSGQTRKAADVFLRLTDRRADYVLSAFLDASRADEVAERR